MEKGQTVYVKKCGYNVKKYQEEIIKCKILTLGSKYFTLETFDGEKPWFSRTKFSIKDMCEESQYTTEYKVYLTEKEITDEQETPIIREKIKLLTNKLTTDQIKEILTYLETKYENG